MYRGKPYVNESMKIEDLPESFVTEKAPRTVIALDSNGTLSLIQVPHSTVTWSVVHTQSVPQPQ